MGKFMARHGRRGRNREQPLDPVGVDAAAPEARPRPHGNSAPPEGFGAGAPVPGDPVLSERPRPTGGPPSAEGPPGAGRSGDALDAPGQAYAGQPAGRAIQAGWSPIVVDEPIFDFEPKAPSTMYGYRPDTVFDGWSTKDFTVRLASVRGYSHRYNGLPRQDDVTTGYDPRSGLVLFAVADGVSSASQSHIGAAIACTTFVETLRAGLDYDGRLDMVDAVEVAASRMADHAAYLLRQERPAPEAVEGLLASTLTAGYIRPAEHGAVVVLIQIGDSGAWVLQEGQYFPLLQQKNDPDAEVISSAVDPLPRLPEKSIVGEYDLPPDAVLLLGTDGFGDPLGDGDGHVGNLFAEHLTTPPPARGLAHLLDFSRDTFDDDRTLLAIWQRARPPERAR